MLVDSDIETRTSERIERALRASLDAGGGIGSPPRLREALRYAVFPGGARLRPRLCLAVAAACGESTTQRADASAVALELMHCASLVHDDLPCFDDAPLRRGRATVHRVFGESTALLVGDALIVLAFRTLGASGALDEIDVLSEAAGPAKGIIAGQAWESEVAVPLDEYHRAKTAALFDAAARMGAMSAGAPPEPWRIFGETVGRAYQSADDLADAVGEAEQLGKLPGRDAALGRPSVVRAYGIEAARRRTGELFTEAKRAIPPCENAGLLLDWMDHLGRRIGL